MAPWPCTRPCTCARDAAGKRVALQRVALQRVALQRMSSSGCPGALTGAWQVYRDPELFGKDVPEPRVDTQPAKWKKD